MNQYTIPLIFGLLASLNIFLGTYLTIRLRKHSNLLLGLAGGIMIGTVAFEILPEIFELAHDSESHDLVKYLMLTFVFGIALFHILSKILPLHEHGHHKHENHDHHTHLDKSFKIGIYGAIVMILHSFIDGFGIGLAFTQSQILGLTVAFSVLMHNLSDGINITSTLLINDIKANLLKLIIIIQITAPTLGLLTSFVVNISKTFTIYYLAFFAGSILYLAISDILPHAHTHSKDIKPVLATGFGIALMFILSLFIAH